MKKKFYHNNNAYNDLDIDTKLFEKIDRTITKFGKEKLRNRLKYCISNYNDLEKMVVINYILSLDQEYIDFMTNKLNEINKIEDNIENWMRTKCNNDLIFSKNVFNNRYLLLLTNKIKISSVIIVIFFYLFTFFYLNYHTSITPSKYVNNMINSYRQFAKLILYYIMSNKYWIDKTALILTISYIGFQVYQSVQIYNNCYKHYNICNNFYKEYTILEKFVNIVEEIYDNEKYFKNDKIKDSLVYLKYYFSKKSSLGFSIVSKLSIHKYIEHINNLVNFIGKIDRQISVISLIKNDGYTIPEFTMQSFPVLHCNNLWNPYINKKNRVSNTLTMDVMSPNVLIVTGPNKSGKSTFMRSIIINVYLCQSLGISCSDNTLLTPFNNIYTYINIPDVIGRESLFEAELNRCYNYIEKTESLNGFTIGAIDELFTGTSPIEGKAGSYAILNRISNNPTNITILSTHYHDMLDKLDFNKYSFCKFSCENINNSFKFNYKINEGISKQCIGIQLLKERGFDIDIINNAINYIELSKK